MAAMLRMLEEATADLSCSAGGVQLTRCGYGRSSNPRPSGSFKCGTNQENPKPRSLRRGDDADNQRQCMAHEQKQESSEMTVEEAQVWCEVVNG